jgi:hypothetical protein
MAPRPRRAPLREAAPLTRAGEQPDKIEGLCNFVVVGNDTVFVRAEYIQIGQLAYRIDQVREYALRGQNLPLSHGRLIQAAMASLVVAADERDSAE